MMLTTGRIYTADWLASVPDSERDSLIDSLSEGAAHMFRHDWSFWAHDEQLAPWSDWRIWLFLGGRGSGKLGEPARH